MARCLIIGCGCHGRRLAGALRDGGHVVRGTTRHPERMAEIEAAGAEAVLADPDRLVTLIPALEHVGVAILLLGGARGDQESLAALHGPRLEALLGKLLDTTVRGVVYETAGSVAPPVRDQGAATVTRLCSASRIPYGLVDLPRDAPGWLDRVLVAVERVLSLPPVDAMERPNNPAASSA